MRTSTSSSFFFRPETPTQAESVTGPVDPVPVASAVPPLPAMFTYSLTNSANPADGSTSNPFPIEVERFGDQIFRCFDTHSYTLRIGSFVVAFIHSDPNPLIRQIASISKVTPTAITLRLTSYSGFDEMFVEVENGMIHLPWYWWLWQNKLEIFCPASLFIPPS